MTDKKFFIVQQTKYNYQHDNYTIHDSNMYDLTTITFGTGASANDLSGITNIVIVFMVQVI